MSASFIRLLSDKCSCVPAGNCMSRFRQVYIWSIPLHSCSWVIVINCLVSCIYQEKLSKSYHFFVSIVLLRRYYLWVGSSFINCNNWFRSPIWYVDRYYYRAALSKHVDFYIRIQTQISFRTRLHVSHNGLFKHAHTQVIVGFTNMLTCKA